MTNMNENKELYWLMSGLMLCNALAANLGMQIIKDENAVFKQSVMLLPIPILWVYHMHYGVEKEKFGLLKMFGVMMLVVSIFLFMWFDREAVVQEKEEMAEKKA